MVSIPACQKFTVRGRSGFNSRRPRNVPYSLMVRIPHSHCGDPGSIPGMEVLRYWGSGNLAACHVAAPGSIPG